MKTVRIELKLLAAGLVAVLALPYTAPTACGARGRMGSETEMTADAGTDTARAPDSGGMCCTLNECGVAQVAPPTHALHVLNLTRTIPAELPAPSSANPTSTHLPLTPPPRA